MMNTWKRVAIAVFAITASLLSACASSTETPQPANITIVQGSGQIGFPGLSLPQALVVKVTDGNGSVVAGQVVDFVVTGGQATINPSVDTTDTDGQASTQVVPASGTTSVQVTATVRSTTLTAVFSETVQEIAGNITCTTANTVTLALGEVRTALAGNGICLQGPVSATSSFMVHAFFQSTVPTAQTQVGIAGFGIASGLSPALNRAPASNTAMTRIGSASAPLSFRGHDPAGSLQSRLRQMERTVLAPLLSKARAARRAAPLRAAVPPTVGQILQFNVDEDCTDASPRLRAGRVVAVTSKAVVVADTGNPAGGFTDPEYQSIGVTFDTLLSAVDEAAFGTPTDIDANGHVVIFYTRAVNELTPAGSGSIVGGFFNPRDLFPKSTCSGTNFAEMFYALVPDPTGTINSNKHLKADVLNDTEAIIGHEYQHLINGSRRAYITDATDFEEVWLNEGLSHIAEELIYYHAADLTPRQNVDSTSVRRVGGVNSQKRLDAVNQFQIENLVRYKFFLDQPMITSPYSDNADSLSNRGAIWGLLRYLADHQGADDGTVWKQLVDSPTSGLDNLTNVFGSNILTRIRDWSISAYTDDLVNASAAYQGLSWNFRQVLPLIKVTSAALSFPLTSGVQTTKTLSGGGALYTTLNVPTNGTAAVAWSVASPNVVISIVRTK